MTLVQEPSCSLEVEYRAYRHDRCVPRVVASGTLIHVDPVVDANIIGIVRKKTTKNLFLVATPLDAQFMLCLGSFVLVLVALSYKSSLASSARRLNDFVHHYEPLSYDPIDVHRTRRWKRSVQGGRAGRSGEVEFAFRAYNREFRLRLQPDRSAFSEDFTLEMHRGPLKTSLGHLYSGHVVGFPDSHVVGAVIGGVFSGRISLARDGEQFYVERAGRYSLESFHSLIYSARDVSFAGSPCGLNGATKNNLDKIRRRYWQQHQQSSKKRRAKRLAPGSIDMTTTSSALKSPKGIRPAATGSGATKVTAFGSSAVGPMPPYLPQERKTYVQRVCNLEITVDHTLFQAVTSEEGGDQRRARQVLTDRVSQHVSAASEIFGSTNFNGITGITFEVQRLVINDLSACEGPAKHANSFCRDNLDASHALLELSKKNHDGFCASYMWMHRDFPGGTLGLAYMADPNGYVGGICEPFQSGAIVEVSTGGSDYLGRLSLNTGVVTFLNKNMRVPQRVSEITFAHELGHSFGSPHDGPAECVPGGAAGNYIMFASATRGTKPNNRRFSVCSVRNISAVLAQMFSERRSRTNCLQEPRGPFCGNSIREADEECDCGFDLHDCSADACCYARDHGELNRRPCTLKPGAVCSPSNGACCGDGCRFHNTTVSCRAEDDCQFEAYCDGSAGDCPPSEWKPDGTLCNHGSQLCESGECTQSVCRRYDLVECLLVGAHLDAGELCLIACRENVEGSECKEACAFKDMKDFCGLRMQPGAPCDDLRGYCDAFQRCRLIDAEGPLARLQRIIIGARGLGNALTRYWYVTLAAVAAAAFGTVVFVRACAVHTPSTNPHLRHSRSLVDSAQHPIGFLKALSRL